MRIDGVVKTLETGFHASHGNQLIDKYEKLKFGWLGR